MFCTKCGKEMADNLKFCTRCGASTGGEASDTAGISDDAGAPGGLSDMGGGGASDIAEQPTVHPEPNMYLGPNGYPAEGVDQGRKQQTQALAAVFAVVTIITMLLGWYSMKIPTSYLDIPWGVGASEFNFTSTALGVANAVGQANGVLEIVESEMEPYTDLYGSSTEFQGFRDIIDAVGTASFVMNVVRICIITAIITLLVFLYMMLVEKQNGALFGQLGGTLAFLAAVIFTISMFMLSSNVSSALEAVGAPGDVLNVSATIWVYLTMVTSALTVSFITVRKNIIGG